MAKKPVDAIISDTAEQPVAFIAHDVGGLVVMKVKVLRCCQAESNE